MSYFELSAELLVEISSKEELKLCLAAALRRPGDLMDNLTEELRDSLFSQEQQSVLLSQFRTFLTENPADAFLLQERAFMNELRCGGCDRVLGSCEEDEEPPRYCFCITGWGPCTN